MFEKRLLVCFILLTLIVTTALSQSPQSESQPGDSGYFLSFRQKGQLIWWGRMQDSAGDWYDIWIVPGFVDPVRQVRINSLKTGRDFGEYFNKKKYVDLAEDSGDAFEWAFDDCLAEFALNDSAKAWKNNFIKASERTEKRVFGWWLAYPWAFLQSATESAVRIPLGATGTVLGSAWGGAVVPAYYSVNSAVKGTVRFGVKVVGLPAGAIIWNTAVSPVMAVAGQKPAPSRADGFWVKHLSEAELEASMQADEPVSREELETLARWGGVLLSASESFDQRRAVLHDRAVTERRELAEKIQERERILSDEERRSLEKVAAESRTVQPVSALREAGYDSRKVGRTSRELREILKSRGEYTDSEISRIIQLLRTYPPASTTNAHSARSPVVNRE